MDGVSAKEGRKESVY